MQPASRQMNKRFLLCLICSTISHLFLIGLLFLFFIPASHSRKDDKNLSATPPLESRTNTPQETKKYCVQPGDSYWKIAHKYNLSVEALQRANGHGTNRVLRQGEMLIIPKSDKKLP